MIGLLIGAAIAVGLFCCSRFLSVPAIISFITLRLLCLYTVYWFFTTGVEYLKGMELETMLHLLAIVGMVLVGLFLRFVGKGYFRA